MDAEVHVWDGKGSGSTDAEAVGLNVSEEDLFFSLLPMIGGGRCNHCLTHLIRNNSSIGLPQEMTDSVDLLHKVTK